MKKIMFNDRYGLTGAVLSGHKTMTRRIINLDKLGEYNIANALKKNWGKVSIQAFIENSARYKVGEIVAIAQSYEDIYHQYGLETTDMLVAELKNHKGWRNKMFVKANLMPHLICITNVRVERLQDISDDDCIKEGVRDYSTPNERRYGYSDFKVEEIVAFCSTREAFAALIDNISWKGTWERNPFVFVYDFELVK